MADAHHKGEFLFKITGVFRIVGRGTIVVGVAGPGWKCEVGDVVEIRNGEQTTETIPLVALEVVQPDPNPVAIVISRELLYDLVDGHTLWNLGTPVANPAAVGPPGG